MYVHACVYVCMCARVCMCVCVCVRLLSTCCPAVCGLPPPACCLIMSCWRAHAVMALGAAINVHSDGILQVCGHGCAAGGDASVVWRVVTGLPCAQNLRKPGDTQYYIPRGGMFECVQRAVGTCRSTSVRLTLGGGSPCVWRGRAGAVHGEQVCIGCELFWRNCRVGGLRCCERRGAVFSRVCVLYGVQYCAASIAAPQVVRTGSPPLLRGCA
jgi:hypothetical protein